MSINRKDKIEKIVNLELFTRSNPLYLNFEERTKYLNEVEISYIFCKECENRDNNLNIIEEWIKCRDNSIDYKENYPLIYNKKFEELKKIDIDLYTYYNNLMETVMIQPLEDDINKKYSVKTMIDEVVLLEVLGEERLNELLYNGLPQSIKNKKGFPYLDFEYLLSEKFTIYDGETIANKNNFDKLYFLTKEEKIKIKNYIKLNPFGFRTIILRDYTKINRDLTSSYFIEIDPTKPIEEIIEFVKTIRDDFEENPKQLPTMYDLLGIRRKKIEFNNLKSEIYTKNNRKTNNQLLADILFIYDCNKANFTQEHIIIEFLNHYGYGIKKSTIKKYLEFAKNYINKKKYLNFINPTV